MVLATNGAWAMWIPVRTKLAEDPSVILMAQLLADSLPDEDCVVGKLVKLWAWANANLSRSGHAPSVTKTWIDRYIGVTGFSEAMRKAGWLIIGDENGEGGGVTFPKFDRYNGNGAKARLQSALRQQMRREVTEDMSRSQRDKSVTVVTNPSRSARDKSVTREDKRREEYITPPTPPCGGAGDGLDAVVNADGTLPAATDSEAKLADAFAFARGWISANRPTYLRPSMVRDLAGLVAEAGRERAIAMVEDAIAKGGIGNPIAYALRVWSSEHAKADADAKKAAAQSHQMSQTVKLDG